MTPQPKPIRERDSKYLAWIRSLPCLLLNPKIDNTFLTQAHHVLPKGQGKTGSKTDDRRAVPLCDICHRQYHNWGRDTFESRNRIDLELEIKKLNAQYDTNHPILIRKPRLLYAETKRVNDIKALRAENADLKRRLAEKEGRV